jgi:O-methyltransferase
MRRGPGSLYRRWKSVEYLLGRDRGDVFEFLAGRLPMPRVERARLIARFVGITNRVRGYHTLGEMLRISGEILRRAAPVVVEAGCGKGSSTAKLSLAVRAAGGRLLVFDSFKGLPANDERHQNLDGREVVFRAGAFRGRINEVQRTLDELGAPEVCQLHRGWFSDTMPQLDQPVDVALLDVDLVESTRTCLRAIVPRLRPGGVIFSLDGQLRATHQLLGDARFWRDELGVPVPAIEGLGTAKLLVIRPR